MQIWFEHSHWGDVLMFGLEIYWEDWHLREFHIALHLGKHILEAHISLQQEKKEE